MEETVFQGPALKYREDLVFLSEQFLLVINNYRTALKQVYLEEDPDDNKKKYLNQIKVQLTEIYNNVMILSAGVIDNIVKEKNKIEKLDNQIADLKSKFKTENIKLNNILDQGKAANPRRLDVRNQMRKSYYMDIFYILAITCGGTYIYSYFKNK
jgi:hypothetical protein